MANSGSDSFGFNPSVERARAAGVRVVRMEFPPGVAGVKLSLAQIAQRIREGANDPAVMGWAMAQLQAAGIDGRGYGDTARRKMAALLDAVRAATVYTPDPPHSETVKSAAAMLCLAPGLCVRGGDCFPEGTLLLRDDFRQVPIEKIEPGQRIWGWNDWSTVVRVWSKGVLAVDELKLRLSDLRLTGDHKVFLGPKVRVRVRELRGGERLLMPDLLTPYMPSQLEKPRPASDPADGTVLGIKRKVARVPCWDISTSDHYVYLPEHDVTVSNCDDMVVLLGSVLMSIGIPVLVVKQTFSAGAQEHVLIHAQDDYGDWVALDPSTNMPAGESAHASQEYAMDPLNPTMIGLTGVPEAEFIGIGALPGTRVVGRKRRWPGLVVARIGVGQAGVVTAPATAPAAGVDPLSQASLDLQNQVQAPVNAGNSYLAAGETASAIQAYQAAGQAGAQVVGPEIDLAGNAAVTQPFTQQAWQLNGQLATATDATVAQSYASQMLSLYRQAIAAGQAAGPPVAGPSLPQGMTWAAALGAIGGVLWWNFKRKG